MECQQGFVAVAQIGLPWVPPPPRKRTPRHHQDDDMFHIFGSGNPNLNRLIWQDCILGGRSN